MSSAAVVPLTKRRVDLLYFAFFLHMVPIMLFIDSAPFLPAQYVLPPFRAIHAYYATTYRDPLQATQPAWFFFFAMTEFLFQLPLGVWALWAIPKDHQLVPLGVVSYASLAAWSTWASVAQILAWDDGVGGKAFGWVEKGRLAGLYGGYGVAFTLMAIHMSWRIAQKLKIASLAEERKKGQ
ncbi:transmembrane protein 6/97 [Kalaharituber pfeilii]|nr:transmembrane protein 6/97 [Kalaharituber pfeilii]